MFCWRQPDTLDA
jgi:hypothetical protein